MPVVPITIHLPVAPWRALQALAPREGDPNTVILRAVEEYATPRQRTRAADPGSIKASSRP